MSGDWANAEQREHMRWLDTIPADEKCASGWHTLKESCRCANVYGFPTLAARNAATRKVGEHWFALPNGEGSDVGPFSSQYMAERWLRGASND